MPDTLSFNGIDAATGAYLIRPMPLRYLAKLAGHERLDDATRDKLAAFWSDRKDAHLALGAGLDDKDLAQTGWGIVFSDKDPKTNAAVKEALGELLALRRTQAGALYREYDGDKCVKGADSAEAFLGRNGAGPAGPVDPTVVPYYLLLIGDADAIPFRLQYGLGLAYAVGRLCFDTLDGYASYAKTVVAAESKAFVVARRAAFFAPMHPGDGATGASKTSLVEPLATWAAAAGGPMAAAGARGWEVDVALGPQATKARLAALLGGADTPAFLFTASHGLRLAKDDPDQRARQGALVCQDWPGPAAWAPAPVGPAYYLSANDIGDDARVAGLIAFHFACYGGGTPQLDDFARRTTEVVTANAAAPFVAALPKRLLGHPRGGALAVVGHVDRAWGCAFSWPDVGPQREVFESALRLLAGGSPVGHAFACFNERYAELNTTLGDLLDDIEGGDAPNDDEVAQLWTASNDARDLVVLGDPAVRLPIGDVATAAAGGRFVLEPVPPRVAATAPK